MDSHKVMGVAFGLGELHSVHALACNHAYIRSNEVQAALMGNLPVYQCKKADLCVRVSLILRSHRQNLPLEHGCKLITVQAGKLRAEFEKG